MTPGRAQAIGDVAGRDGGSKCGTMGTAQWSFEERLSKRGREVSM
jgi:hypothetical protein